MKKLVIIAAGVFVVFALGFFARTSTELRPWGSIQFVQFTTNGTTTRATYRFTNLCDWPVLNEIATKTTTYNEWAPEPDYPLRLTPLSRGASCTFAVDVPEAPGPWRVLVRCTKQNITEADRKRMRMRSWFRSKGMNIIANRISVVASSGMTIMGPETSR